MTRKYIGLRQVVAALRIAADGIETGGADELTLQEVYLRLDDALRVVIGRAAFNKVEEYLQHYGLYSYYDDETTGETGDDPETPKF